MSWGVTTKEGSAETQGQESWASRLCLTQKSCRLLPWIEKDQQGGRWLLWAALKMLLPIYAQADKAPANVCPSWQSGLYQSTVFPLQTDRRLCSVMSNSLWAHALELTRLLCPCDSSGKNTGVGCHALLQEIFPTQGSNHHLLCLLHWRQVLYH